MSDDSGFDQRRSETMVDPGKYFNPPDPRDGTMWSSRTSSKDLICTKINDSGIFRRL